jgi:EAL and modified HD-GYP domain-containing signal transduction protein
MGLFSLIDAMLDNNMENIMQSLPLSKNIKQALQEGKGDLADYLNLVSCYESADWDTFSSIISKMNINEKKLPEFYQEAVSWADSYLF